jgi:hypothetical protein
MGRIGGARGVPSGSAGGLAAVAEIEGADDASASPSSSPAAAPQEHLQQQMLAAQTQLAQLFGPGALQQVQAALQAHPTLVSGNAPQPPSADLASVLAALTEHLLRALHICRRRLQCFGNLRVSLLHRPRGDARALQVCIEVTHLYIDHNHVNANGAGHLRDRIRPYAHPPKLGSLLLHQHIDTRTAQHQPSGKYGRSR